jgi:hypothetical protein
MTARNRIVTPLAFALSLAPLSLFSQDAPPPTDQVEQWIVEMQYLQTQLAPIEEQALLEPALAQEQEVLGDAVLAAMIEADPTVEPKLARLREIMLEAHGSMGDDAKIVALAAEAQTLQPAVERAKGAALAKPEIEAMIAAFRKRLCDRMVEIAPEARQMVDRFEELEKMIKTSLRQGAASGASSRLLQGARPALPAGAPPEATLRA